MKRTTRRIMAFLTAAALALSLTACVGGNSGAGGNEAGDVPEGKLFAPGTELDVIVNTYPGNPYNENWPIWGWIMEATGVKLNVKTIPSVDYTTKLPLMMASPEELPDLLHMFMKEQVTPYAADGAFVAFDDNMDKLPNYTAFVNSLPENERIDMLNQRKCSDGKIYSALGYGTHKYGSRVWMYRKDIFEKHNLKVPTDYNELYEVCKELKKLYPDSYPLCIREGMFRLEELTPAWKPYFSYSFYYDFNNEKWGMGAREPLMKEIIEYFLKFYKEGLIEPEWTTIATSSWEQLMSTDRGFISMDYASRIGDFNYTVRNDNPEFTLAFMAPPAANVEGGRQAIANGNMDNTGYTICNTGKQDRIDNAFKFVDWMYTDEAIEILSWGKEGQSFEVVNGKKQHILEEGELATVKYGFTTSGVMQVIDEEAYESTLSAETVEACKQALEYIEPYVQPGWWLAFNDEEVKIKNMYYDAVRNYCVEEITKFLMGQKPMSEWDNFVKGIDELGAKEVIAVYESAYKRAAGK